MGPAKAATGCFKPEVGRSSPPGKKTGHADAIVMGERGTYASKRQAFEAAGVTVLDLPSQVGEFLAEKPAG